MTFSQGMQHENGIDREERNDSNDSNVAGGAQALLSLNPPPAVPVIRENKGNGNNVSALVAKSKKAASSLWTLLHAKNCRLGVHRCSHPGCSEAKLIYLHLKTCNTRPGVPCPTQHKGCGDARKLLAHYRRCRDIRARQTSNRQKTQQHVCLVCSLVARYAKGSLDRNRSTSPKCRKHLIPSLNLSSDSCARDQNFATQALSVRARSTSPNRGEKSGIVSSFSLRQNGIVTSSTPMKMPPPPPRFAFSKQPPSSNDHLLDTGDKQILKSAVFCALDATSSDDMVDPADESLLGKSVDSASGFFRPRAESLDLRRSNQGRDSNWRGNTKLSDADPALTETESFVEEKLSGTEEFRTTRTTGRRRSLSCSVPSSSQNSSGGFDPILEEPVGEELQRMLERDS